MESCKLGNLPSDRTAPLVAVLCIGVQGKIFICGKGFAAEKKLENH